jgi:ABC-2 type transport system ATP-binding protein
MVAVKFNNVGKKYIISHEKEALVRHILPKFLRIKTYEELWALKGINLQIKPGETLGILGRNGAGKTTLLNLVAGITFATEGKVSVKGKISSLLSLGAGFHTELTGEENIYINGAILGLKMKEIRRRFKDIVDFSELGDFISAPLQTYSTGMYLRLGFAIAVNVDFDILLMDEVLTVGDISFQKKCLDRIREFQSKGKTIILISQSVDLINTLCHRAVLLDKGTILYESSPEEVIDLYRSLMSKEITSFTGKGFTEPLPVLPVINEPAKSTKTTYDDCRVPKDAWGRKMGNKEAEIVEVNLLNQKNEETLVFSTGECMKIRARYIVRRQLENPHFGVAIFREDGTYCYGPNTRLDGLKIDKLRQGEGDFSIEYKNLMLLPGKYRLSVAIWGKDENLAYDHHYAFYKFEVISEKKDHGILYLAHIWSWNLP